MANFLACMIFLLALYQSLHTGMQLGGLLDLDPCPQAHSHGVAQGGSCHPRDNRMTVFATPGNIFPSIIAALYVYLGRDFLKFLLSSSLVFVTY